MELTKADLALLFEALCDAISRDNFDCAEDKAHARELRLRVAVELDRRPN